MSDPKAVIFDMDGVLVDTEPIYISINRTLFAELGVTMSKEKLLTYVGISSGRFWGEIRKDYSLPQSLAELIAQEKERHAAYFSRMPIPEVAGARELITELTGEGISLAVASSSSMATISTILTKTGLISFFPELVSGQDIARGKPAPDIFLLAAERLRISPENCLVIEDSPHGVAGAKEAGMRCVGYANPNSGRQNLSRADMVVDDFSLENRERIVSLLLA